MVALWGLLIVIAVVGLVVGLAFTPYPGHYNVKVVVTAIEVPAIAGTYFQITSVTPSVAGQSTILDIGGLAFSGPAINAQFAMTVCVGSNCVTSTTDQWFPSIPVVNGGTITATNTFTVGYVPSGQATVTVTLTENSNQVASGQSSICVGC